MYLCEVGVKAMPGFWSTEVSVLDYRSESVGLYVLTLCAYAGVLVGQHFLTTTTHQLHREALTMSKNRPLTKLVGFNVLRTIVHVINVLFISSNNFGVLVVSVLGHALGVFLVYRSQRTDLKHPVRSLLNALQHPPDLASKRDVAELLSLLRNTRTKF